MPFHLPVADERRQALLRELAEVAMQALSPQIDGFTNRLADALLQAAQGGDEQQAALCRLSAELLRKNRYPFHYVVAARLAGALARGLQLEDGGGEALPPLPPDLEIDKKLCLLKAGQALEREHAEALGMLDRRLTALYGEAQAAPRNPFRPEVLLTALHEAWCEFQPEAAAHHLVYRLLGPRLCIDAGPLLHALNATLSKRGIDPQAVPAPKPVAEDILPAAPDNDPLLLQLRQLFPPAVAAARPPAHGFPALFQDEVLHASNARHELMQLLSRMQDRLASLPAEEMGRAMAGVPLSSADAAAIDLVARIFAVIRANRHLPEQLKTAILSLHLPVLKAALEDHDFFFQEGHGARRALELLVRLAMSWDRRKGDADPCYPLFCRSIARLRAEAGRHAGVFAEVTAELEACLRREQSETEQALAAPIAQALKQAKRLQAQRAARHQVALRLAGGTVAPFVESFLEEKWTAVLTLAYVARDEKPQAVDGALRAMDELIWSVQPKISAEERKELLSRLPPMVAMLNRWLDVVKWTGEGRARFFTELAKCHASLVRAPVDMTPQRQVELAVEAAQRAAERREQRLLAQQPEPEPDACDAAVANLQSGAWLAFHREDGDARQLKLAWVSPMRNLYLFATRDRKEALTLQAEQLAQALREQRAQMVPAAGLVGRALADALGVGNGDTAALEAA